MKNKKRIGDIPYMEILKKSFQLTWKNKFLWWFGFFIALGGSGSFNLNFPGSTNDVSDQQAKDFFLSLSDFWHQYAVWIIAGLFILIAISVALYALSKIGRGALIKSIEKINKGEIAKFKTGWLEGKKYLWKILGLDILLGLSLTIILLIVIAPSVILFIYKSYISGALLMFLAIFFVIILAIITSFLKNFGHIYIVLANLSIWNSIEKAYDLFRKNIWTSILMSLILMATSMVIGILFLFAFFVIILFFAILGVIAWLTLKTLGLIILGVIFVLFFLITISILRSALEVFYQTSWILFFKEIAAQSKTQEIVAKPVLEVKIETKTSESVNLTKN